MGNKVKVLLLSPNLKGIKGGVNRIQPSLGIGYLAAVLERGGHKVYVRDTALEGASNEILLKDARTIVRGELRLKIFTRENIKYSSDLDWFFITVR